MRYDYNNDGKKDYLFITSEINVVNTGIASYGSIFYPIVTYYNATNSTSSSYNCVNGINTIYLDHIGKEHLTVYFSFNQIFTKL